MEPKTKLHKQVTELSKLKLPPITEAQIQWGYDHCLDKYAHISRGRMYCLECGHEWKPEKESKRIICPECQAKLKMIPEYRSYCNQASYYAIVTICEGFQVVRMIYLSKTFKMKREAHYYESEVMQHWFDETMQVSTMTKTVNGLSGCCDQWNHSSEMQVRVPTTYNASYRHELSPYMSYPKASILPAFKRNGFTGDFHSMSPVSFLRELLRNTYLETLLKAKQYSLLRLFYGGNISRSLWPSVKICIRNKYIVKDAKMWKDYIDLLEYFRKDLHNAFYVCPTNLKKAHDELMERKRKIQLREKLEKQREKLLKDQSAYAKQKGKFFGILFTDGKLMIKTLESVEEVMKEGDALHHCVFTNEYYKKPDSLIMSARIDDKPIETIEISLKNFEVVQSRGLQNKSSEYHDQIISLVRKNIKVIQEKKSIKRQKIAV